VSGNEPSWSTEPELGFHAGDIHRKPNGQRRGCRIGDLLDRVPFDEVDGEAEIPGDVGGAMLTVNGAAALEIIRRLIGRASFTTRQPTGAAPVPVEIATTGMPP
jgi:hypothetical protein